MDTRRRLAPKLRTPFATSCAPRRRARLKSRRIKSWSGVLTQIGNEAPTDTSEYVHIAQGGCEGCIEQLSRDSVVGPHLDRTVGANDSGSGLTGDRVLLTLIYGILDVEGSLQYIDEHFDRVWSELADFFCADRVAVKMVAPLPHLGLPTFPLALNDELVLDRLTDDEVTRCCQVGVLGPETPRLPLIYGTVAVGVRRTMFSPKVIRTSLILS